MGSRSEQITIYVTEERKTELEQRADDEGDSLSGVINDMIDQQLQQEAQDAIASEARAEERIQELIQVGTEEMTAAAREIREMNAKFGAYAIANFELMKRDRSDHVRKQALSTGAQRIRQDLDVVTDELAVDDPAADGDGVGEPAAGAGAAEESEDVSMSAADAMTGGDDGEGPAEGTDASKDGEDDAPGRGGLFDRLRGEDG